MQLTYIVKTYAAGVPFFQNWWAPWMQSQQTNEQIQALAKSALKIQRSKPPPFVDFNNLKVCFVL